MKKISKKTWGIIIAALLVIAAVVVVILVTRKPAETEKAFKMGIDPEYPPFSYMGADGNYTGFDVEMAEAVCKINGWKLEIVPINWDHKLISLDNKEHDCIWSGMTILDSMKGKYTLSFPYFDNTQVVLTKEGSGISTLADLAGKRVAVQAGTSGYTLLAEDQKALADTFDGGAPVTMNSFVVCGVELDSNGVDAVVVDLPVAQALSAKYSGFVILEENLGSEQYGICFRLDDTELCKQVEEAYNKLVKDGTYKKLAEKYELDLNQMCLLDASELAAAAE